MPKVTDGRQQFQGNTAVAAGTQNTPPSYDVLAAFNYLSGKLAALAANLLWFVKLTHEGQTEGQDR